MLPWTQLHSLLTHLVTFDFQLDELSRACVTSGVCMTQKGAVHPPNQLFSPLFKIRKAGVKSHFENLLLSIGDALETTLLTRLIVKCKLIVCSGH